MNPTNLIFQSCGVLNSNPFLNGENMPVLKYRSISYVNRFMLISGCYVRIERWAMLPLDPTWSCAQGGLKTLYRIPGRVVPACQIQTLLQTTVNLNLDIWLIYVLNWVTLAYFGILWLHACLAILAELILTNPVACIWEECVCPLRVLVQKCEFFFSVLPLISPSPNIGRGSQDEWRGSDIEFSKRSARNVEVPSYTRR
jgi:hypothetical protein